MRKEAIKWITSGTWDLGDDEKQRLESALGLVKGSKVLDIGTRDGTFALTLARERPDVDVSAYDTDASSILWAEKTADVHHLENITLWVDDLTNPKMPLQGTFDTVVLMETLEHIPPDQVQVAHDNALAYLKEGGRLIVSVPANTHISDPDHKTVFYREQFHGRAGIKWADTCPHLWIMYYVDREPK